MILAPYPFHDEEPLSDDRRIDFATLIAWLFAGQINEPNFCSQAHELGASADEVASVLVGLKMLDGVA